MSADEDYKICQEACKEWGCYCPPSHEFHSKRANTPAFIRAFFERKGYIKALDDHHIIHGESAELFIARMVHTDKSRELTEREKELLRKNDKTKI